MTWLTGGRCDDVDEPSFFANLHRLGCDDPTNLTQALAAPCAAVAEYSFARQLHAAVTRSPFELAAPAVAIR